MAVISLVIYGSRDALPTVDEIDREVDRVLIIGESISCTWERPTIDHVICGGAHGADLHGYQWARARDLPIIVMGADWDTNGKRAGYVRNAAMAERATHGLGFWRNWSRGTAHMTTCLVMLGKPVRIVEWEP